MTATATWLAAKVPQPASKRRNDGASIESNGKASFPLLPTFPQLMSCVVNSEELTQEEVKND